ncbi:hypothetical protein D3C86_636760 [compost metagenome]
MVDVKQFEVAVEVVGVQADGHALPGAAGEAIEVGGGAGIALGAVLVQTAADLVADGDGSGRGRRRPLLQRQAIVALGAAADRRGLDHIFARLGRGEDEVGVQPLARAVVVLGCLNKTAVDHAAHADQRVEVIGFQQDGDALPRVRAEGVGVEGLAVLVLGVAAGQAAGHVAADRDPTGTRLTRGHPLTKGQGVGARLHTREGPRANDVDAVAVRGEAQAGVHAAAGAVVVGGQRVARGAALGVDRQIGIEIAAAHFGLKPLPGAKLHPVVVVTIGVAAASARIPLFQPSTDFGADTGVDGCLGEGGAGRQQGDDAGRREQGPELRMTHENLFAGAIIDAEPQRL